MDPFVDEVQSNLGEALRAIGATFIKHSVTGQGLQETNVCFFSASDKIIAINHRHRDGFTCFAQGH